MGETAHTSFLDGSLVLICRTMRADYQHMIDVKVKELRRQEKVLLV